MKILFITNLPSPYRVDFFNELGKKIDLTVCYERESSSERDAKWINKSKRTYKELFVSTKNIGVDRSIGFGIVKELKNKYDFVIISGWSSPSVILAILYCQIHNILYIMEDDGGLINPNGEKHKLIKKLLLRKLFAYFTTTNENISVITSLGVEQNRVYKYPFSSVMNSDISEGISKKQKVDEIRKSLGINENNIILAVGQFIDRKGFDVLLKAFSNMNDDCGLYFVGGEPTKQYLDIVHQNNIQNVHFIGFTEKEKLKLYYAAADVFVLPTREDIWGLVINEAMAAGLPVITTNRCGAGLELIKNNQNGYLVQVDDVDNLSEKIHVILNNKDLKNKMENNATEVIKNYTVEKMAQWHYEQLSKFKKSYQIYNDK